MITGLPPALPIAPNSATTETPTPARVETTQQLIEWLLAQPRIIELMLARNAAFLEVACFARREGDYKFVQDKWELDSGDWLLVRVSDATPGETDAGGLQRVSRNKLSADKEKERN